MRQCLLIGVLLRHLLGLNFLAFAFPATARFRLFGRGTLLAAKQDAAADDKGEFNGWQFPNMDSFEIESNRPSKADLYSTEELQNLLDIHNNLSEKLGQQEDKPKTISESSIGSLHEMVLGTLQEIEEEETSRSDSRIIADDTTSFAYKIDDKMRGQLLQISAIASDVDGTMLSSKHDIHPRTAEAVKKAIEAAFSPVRSLQFFFPATGKSREGALRSLGPEIGGLLSQVPGVFIQGLYCVDATGKVVFEKKLSGEEIAAVERLAKDQNVSLIAYDGDSLYASSNSDPKHILEVHERWGEPLPKVLDSLANHEAGFHKCLVMVDEPYEIESAIRPKMEKLASEFGATVTQAIPTMLEFLPSGCSKALGVQKLCQALGIDPSQQLLAIGDAENDVEMLEMAAIGIAVSNAVPKAKAAADFVLDESNDAGGAGVAIESFGLGKILANYQ